MTTKPLSLVNSVPRYDFEVRHKQLFEDAQELVTLVFPDWQTSDLELHQCKDGITNKLIRCVNKRLNHTVLIRAYGRNTETIIDRNQELNNMAGLAQLGMCPPLHARFNNGLMYGFIPGTVAVPKVLASPEWAPLIARKLAQWANVELPGATNEGNQSQLFPVIRRWMQDVPQKYSNGRDQKIFQQHFSLDKLAQEANELETMVQTLNSPVVFSHNDLLAGNIIRPDSGGSVSFIDYEYAMYNYRGFDIANHFNEYAGFECDYSRYPSKEFQVEWFKIYLDQPDASSKTLETMYHEVSVFQLASHFYWGVWALVQASISDIDFDYMDYARLRFDQYYKVKEKLNTLV